MNRTRTTALTLASAMCLGVMSMGAASNETDLLEPYFGKWDRYYEAHPELKTTPGSGFEAYMHARWFAEQRVVPGRPLPTAADRWAAWEAKMAAERSRSGEGFVWFNVGPDNLAGRVSAIDFDPTNTDIIYAGAGGGVWKSTDHGLSWMPMSDQLPSIAIGGLAVSKTNPNVVVAGTGEAPTNWIPLIHGGVGIYRSTDAGLTWVPTSLQLPDSTTHAFDVVRCGPDGTFLAGATDGLWRSSDDGATWTQVKVGGRYTDIAWKPGSTDTIFVARGNGPAGNNVKISTDGGLTFSKAGTGQPPSLTIGKTKIGVTPADPDVVYACYASSASGGPVLGIWRSTDCGATWIQRNGAGMPGVATNTNVYLVCAVDPENPAEVFVGAGNLSRSVDAADSFSPISAMSNGSLYGDDGHNFHRAIYYEPGSVTDVWLCNLGGIYQSTDDGVSWSYRSSGLVTLPFYDVCVSNAPNAYFVVGGANSNGNVRGTPASRSWEMIRPNGTGTVCNINRNNATTIYIDTTFGFHYKSINGGATFSSIMTGITGRAQTVDWLRTPIDEAESPGNLLYTATDDGVFKTTNGGGLWTNVAPHRSNVWIDISPVDPDVVWTVANASLGAALPPFYTTDGGASWTQTNPFAPPLREQWWWNGQSTRVLAHPTDINTAFVTFSGYGAGLTHVAMTSDMGATWTDVTGDFPSQPVNAIAVDPLFPEFWYIGTDVGVWWSDNGGTNWVPFGTGLPNTVVIDLEIAETQRKLVAGTHGRGAWEIWLRSPVSANLATLEARNLMLDPPWPNPVEGQALFRFAAKSTGSVTLRIYDVQGRLVSDLAEYSRGDGIIRTVAWLPDDVPSGVYFAVLRADGNRKSQKITVAR